MFSSHSLNEDKSYVLEEAASDTVLCSCTIINYYMLVENFFVIGAHHFFTALVKQ